MSLKYIGKSVNRRLNGRKLDHGDLITDEREIADLTGDGASEAQKQDFQDDKPKAPKKAKHKQGDKEK